jgi:hypothetical protein
MEVGGEIRNGQIALITIRFPPPRHPSLVARLPAKPWLARAIRIGYEHLPAALVRPFMVAFITSVLQPARAFYESGAVLVDGKGDRLGDETTDLALTLAERGGPAYVVFDRKLADKYSRWPHFLSTAPGVGYAYVQDYRRHRRDLWHEGSAVAALAAKLGVPGNRLTATIAEYNRADAKGDRLPIRDAPFYALGPLRPLLIFTDGGLAIDAEMRVVGTGGAPVPGLYAAGSVGQGGMLLDGHGHHLGWAFTSGRIAGRNAVRHGASADTVAGVALDRAAQSNEN